MNVIDSADLWFPGHPDGIGWPHHAGAHYRPGEHTPDPLRYVVWVHPRPPSEEQAPRTALHVAVAA